VIVTLGSVALEALKPHSISRVEFEGVSGGDSLVARPGAGADLSSESAGARVTPAREAAVAGLPGSGESSSNAVTKNAVMKQTIATDSDLMTQYAAVRDGGVGVIDLSARGRISVSGSEAVMFLNGLITNDLKTLGENRWMPAAFPNVQGRLLAFVV
jgi:hypothetical protein